MSDSFDLDQARHFVFANNLDLGQARQDVEPDLDPNCLTSLSGFLNRTILKKKISRRQKTCTISRHAKI